MKVHASLEKCVFPCCKGDIGNVAVVIVNAARDIALFQISHRHSSVLMTSTNISLSLISGNITSYPQGPHSLIES